MPRAKSQSRAELVDSALMAFWKYGYHVVSMRDLVQETGVSRGGIYTDYPSKRELFHACLQRYQETVVTPAFACVEADAAGLESIGQYLGNLIARLDDSPDASLGCLVSNTLGQIDHSEEDTLELLEQHNQRLTVGFLSALHFENLKHKQLSTEQVEQLANFTSLSVRGMFAVSRASADAAVLQQYADTLLSCLRSHLQHG